MEEDMKKEEKIKEKKTTEVQKPNIDAEVYDNKKFNWKKKRKAQKLNWISFANKVDNYNRGGKKKKKKSIYRASQKIRIINVFLESLLSESFPSLGVAVHLTSLGCPLTLCSSLDLLWGSSDSNLVLLLCVLASNVHSYEG